MSMISTRKKTLLALSSAIGLVQSAPLWAQDQSGSPADIVVTARRVEERLQDVPISITVFNQQQIANKNINNLNDLAIETPGLGQSNPLGSLQSTFSLRGFFAEAGTAATVAVFFNDVVAPRGASNQQAVGDGAGPGSFFDLQNVQVLKGPQGTLFGRNTTGGAILLVPQKPTDKFEGYVEGQYGNFNMRRLQGVLNIPLMDTARLRLGADYQKRDGYVKNNTNIGPSRFNDTNYYAFRAGLDVDLTPNLENYTLGTYAHSKTNGEVNGLFHVDPAAAAAPIPNFFAYLAQQELNRYPNRSFYSFENNLPNPRTELDQWQISNTTTWRASDNITIKNIASYAQLKYDLVNPVVGVAFDLSDFNPYGQALMNAYINPRLTALGLPAATFVPYPKGTILPFTNSNPGAIDGNTANQFTATEEFQIQGNALDNRLTYQSGFYYERSGPLGRSGSLSPNLLICPNYNTSANSYGLTCANPFFGFGGANYNEGYKTIQTVGLYTQATYEINDKFKLTGGIRYTWDETKAHGALRIYTPPYNPYSPNPVAFNTITAYTCGNPDASLANQCTQYITQKAHAPTWLIDLDYKPSNDLLLYAKYSRGYRAGGVALQLPTELQTYKPEKVDTYEAGVKATLRGPVRGTFNVAGFYNDFSNQQIPIGVVPKVIGSVANALGVFNAGKSRIYGIEVESALNLFKGLVWSTGYSYLNTKLTSVTLPTISNPASPYLINPLASPRVGDVLPNTSKNKVSTTLSYTLPLDRSSGVVTVSGTYTYSSRQVSTSSLRNPDGSINNLGTLAPRNIVDANIMWKGVLGSKVDASIFVTNLFQEHYYTYILDVSSGFQMGQIGQPRFFGGRLRYNF